jgi:hypothetical protein
MLWLKAWFETRWRIVWALLMGAALIGFQGFVMTRIAGMDDPKGLAALVLAMSALSLVATAIATIVLAGSGIETASTRPGAPAKGAAESTLFTLALPVTRARLFAVRTVTGLLETTALVTTFAVATWLLLPPATALNPHDVLGYFAALISCGLTVYAVSACLSTFVDDAWRIKLSAVAVSLLATLAFTTMLPRPINPFRPIARIFRPIVQSSPLITHQIPWTMIAMAVALSVLFLAAALAIIQKRDY